MCDALVVVSDNAGHGFCSPECRQRHDRLGGELDKMLAHLRQAIAPDNDEGAA
jgi:hypothetical protein